MALLKRGLFFLRAITLSDIVSGISICPASSCFRKALSARLSGFSGGMNSNRPPDRTNSESKRLKEVNQLKNSLYANITHEFRTPLTVIKGMTGLIRSDFKNKQPDDLENSLEMINRNSDSLMHLVNEMLDLAKIESGNMELQLIQTNVIPFVKYLAESFHSLAEEKNISFSVYSEIDHLEMDFDANKLTSIVTNLLSNAIKFTLNNGKILVRLNKIHKKNTEFFVFEIKDSGLGIREEELLHIFDKFYQVNNSSSKRGEGTGIGLSLVREFVELMNGSIGVESIHGKGSVFKVKIPISAFRLLCLKSCTIL